MVSFSSPPGLAKPTIIKFCVICISFFHFFCFFFFLFLNFFTFRICCHFLALAFHDLVPLSPSGVAKPLFGASVGFLPQEPELEGNTVPGPPGLSRLIIQTVFWGRLWLRGKEGSGGGTKSVAIIGYILSLCRGPGCQILFSNSKTW